MNLNRFVRYEAEVEQLILSHHKQEKGGRKPQNVPLTERRCALLCEKKKKRDYFCAMKLARNGKVKKRKTKREHLLQMHFCRQNLTLNSSHFLQIEKNKQK